MCAKSRILFAEFELHDRIKYFDRLFDQDPLLDHGVPKCRRNGAKYAVRVARTKRLVKIRKNTHNNVCGYFHNKKILTD